MRKNSSAFHLKMLYNIAIGEKAVPFQIEDKMAILKVMVDIDGVLFDFHSAACTRLTNLGFSCFSKEMRSHDIRHHYTEIPEGLVEKWTNDGDIFQKEVKPFTHVFDELGELLMDPLVEIDFVSARPIHLEELTRGKIWHNLGAAPNSHKTVLGRPIRLEVRCLGSTLAKCEVIVQNDYDIVIEDNPKLFELLLEHTDFDLNRCYLYSQPWNRDDDKWQRVPDNNLVALINNVKLNNTNNNRSSTVR